MTTDKSKQPMPNLSGLQFLVQNLQKSKLAAENTMTSCSSVNPSSNTGSTGGNSPGNKNSNENNGALAGLPTLTGIDGSNQLSIDTQQSGSNTAANAVASTPNNVTQSQNNNLFSGLDILGLQKQIAASNDPAAAATALLLRLKEQNTAATGAPTPTTPNQLLAGNGILSNQNISNALANFANQSSLSCNNRLLEEQAAQAQVQAAQAHSQAQNQSLNNGNPGDGHAASNILNQLRPTPPVSPMEGSTASNGNNNNPEGWTFEEQFKQLYDLDTDYSRRKFLDDLFSFMQKRGTPVNRIPIMAKQVLDLYKLYKLVVEKGGLVEVINKKIWREITKGLNLPSSITSAAFTLRTQYMKYLYPFECEKEGLSNPAELQAAIDGNRREGRRPTYGSPSFMGAPNSQQVAQNAAYLTAIAAASSGDPSAMLRLQQSALAAQQANNMQNAQKVLLAQAHAAAQAHQAQAQAQLAQNAAQMAQKANEGSLGNANGMNVNPGYPFATPNQGNGGSVAMALEALQNQNKAATGGIGQQQILSFWVV